jgi:transcriptional regulator with XRE-family HTH domain
MTDLLFEFLGDRIRERSWTIPHFAKAVGVSPQLAYKWMAEDPAYRITPGPKSCEKIASALGVDLDSVLELAGHRPQRSPELQLSARRQSIRAQLDQWLTAVGEENEPYFWEYLKAHGQSGVDLISRIRTAVNTDADTAVNEGVSGRAKRGRKPRGTSRGPLSTGQRSTSAMLNGRIAVAAHHRSMVVSGQAA